MTKPETSAYFRSMISIIVAYVMVARDLDFRTISQELIYIPYMGAAFCLSSLIWVLIGRITKHLNQKYDWVERPLERFIIQGLASIITPVFLMVTAVGFLSFLIHGISALTTDYLVRQLLASGTFVLFVNLLFFIRYLRWRMEETRRILQRDFPYFSNLRF